MCNIHGTFFMCPNAISNIPACYVSSIAAKLAPGRDSEAESEAEKHEIQGRRSDTNSYRQIGMHNHRDEEREMERRGQTGRSELAQDRTSRGVTRRPQEQPRTAAAHLGPAGPGVSALLAASLMTALHPCLLSSHTHVSLLSASLTVP